MARKINSEVLIKDVFFDEDLYPRSSFNWQTAYDYSESIKAGAKFPAITLALLNNKKYLVDGKHRLEAYRNLKRDKIPAIVHTGWNKKKIFEEAIKSNIEHGRVLSPYEKRKIAQKLLELKYSNKQISSLIQVPMDKLEGFVAKNMVNTVTGEAIDLEKHQEQMSEIGQVIRGGLILKSGMKHLSGTDASEEEVVIYENVQRDQNMHSQVDLLKQLIDLIENKLLDLDNKKVKELYNHLINLLKSS